MRRLTDSILVPMRFQPRPFALLLTVVILVCGQRGAAQEAASMISPEVAGGSKQAEPQELDTPAPPSVPQTSARPPENQAERAPATDVAKRGLAIQLVLLDGQIADLSEARESQGLVGPIALIVLGSAVGTFFGLGAIALGSMLSDVKDDLHNEDFGLFSDVNSDGVVDEKDLRGARRETAAVASISILHLGLAAFGGWWVGKRLSARHAMDARLRRLNVERQVLDVKLDMRADSGSAMGLIVGRF